MILYCYRVEDQRMKTVRKKLRMNSFMHSEFDPNLTFSSAAPLLEKVFLAADWEYDEDTEKGNTYIMDYILNDLPQPEVRKLWSKIMNVRIWHISEGVIIRLGVLKEG